MKYPAAIATDNAERSIGSARSLKPPRVSPAGTADRTH
jgi:hypothetical protein